MKKFPILLYIFVILFGVSLQSAYAANEPIYGAGMRLYSNQQPQFKAGTDYNTFNRFVDSSHLCRLSNRTTTQTNNDCMEGNKVENAYTNEQNFVLVSKVGYMNGSSLVKSEDQYYYHNYTNTVKENDVLNVNVWVHNNAKTITNNPRYTAKDIKASITQNGGVITGNITASNATQSTPTQAQEATWNAGRPISDSISISDVANITLPQGYTLQLIGDSAYAAVCNGTISCGNEGRVKETTKFSTSGSTITYAYGDMVGSLPGAILVSVNYKIVKDTTVTPPTATRYGQCVSPTSYRVQFAWTEAASKVQVSTNANFTGTVYERNVSSSDRQVVGPEGFSPSFSFNVGTKYYWRIQTSNGTWKTGNVIDFNCNDSNPETPQATKAECIDLTRYRVNFNWTQNGYNKIQVSTSSNFTNVYEKAVNGKSTSGPEGFSPSLTFTTGTRYYWRVGNGTQWTTGNSFDFDCKDYRPPTGPICGNFVLDPGEECDDGGYNGIGDGCTADCKIIKFNECREGSCACVEVKSVPNVAGDFNRSSFVVTVENKTVADTLVRRVELVRKKADGTNGETWIIRDGNDSSKLGEITSSKKQGIFIPTSVDIKTYPLNQTLRAKHDPRNTMPISLDTSAYMKDQSQPIYINNLFTGEKVDVVINGTARTSYPSFEFDKDTVNVGYLLTFATQSNVSSTKTAQERIMNVGRDELLITRPYILTYNDGDLFTSALITGIANLQQVVGEYSGNTFKNISGIILNASGLKNKIDGTTINVGVKTQDLQKNIDKSITAFETATPVVSNEVRISTENDLSRLTQRADGTRVYMAKGNVVLGSDGDTSDYTATKSSTIVVDGGTLFINKNVKYQSGNSSVTMAFIVRNGGKIVIHPRVDELNGVYVALDNGQINGDANWKSYYEKNQPKVLVVKGALYGNTQGLIDSRPNVGDARQNLLGSAGIAISFDGRLYSFTPPGLQEIVGTVFEKLR